MAESSTNELTGVALMEHLEKRTKRLNRFNDSAARQWHKEWRERSDALMEDFDITQTNAERIVATDMIGEDLRRIRRFINFVEWLLICAAVGALAALFLK